MTRKHKPKPLCIYCQKVEGSTRDHVFPDAWYPTTTPPQTQHLTAPCCVGCNRRLHSAEDAVGLDLVLFCQQSNPA